MTQIFSNAHIDCVIDGHRVEGLADEERPFDFGDGDDRFNIVRSRNDGGMYASANARVGGPFTLRLAPTSPTAAWLIERNEEQKRAQREGQAIRIFEITFSDSVQGRETRMEGCLLQKCPDQVEAGITFEVMFECEIIETNNDGARFTAPLTSAA